MSYLDVTSINTIPWSWLGCCNYWLNHCHAPCTTSRTTTSNDQPRYHRCQDNKPDAWLLAPLRQLLGGRACCWREKTQTKQESLTKMRGASMAASGGCEAIANSKRHSSLMGSSPVATASTFIIDEVWYRLCVKTIKVMYIQRHFCFT